jgi:hypothetical protein
MTQNQVLFPAVDGHVVNRTIPKALSIVRSSHSKNQVLAAISKLKIDE